MAMSEYRMEVVSESEAREFCVIHNLIFDHIYIGKGSNEGNLMMLAYKRDNEIIDEDFVRMAPQAKPKRRKTVKKVAKDYETIIQESEDSKLKPKPKYVVGTYCNGQLMMVGKGGRPTFVRSEAKKFDKKDAQIKASMMTKNSKNGHLWIANRA